MTPSRVGMGWFVPIMILPRLEKESVVRKSSSRRLSVGMEISRGRKSDDTDAGSTTAAVVDLVDEERDRDQKCLALGVVSDGLAWLLGPVEALVRAGALEPRNRDSTGMATEWTTSLKLFFLKRAAVLALILLTSLRGDLEADEMDDELRECLEEDGVLEDASEGAGEGEGVGRSLPQAGAGTRGKEKAIGGVMLPVKASVLNDTEGLASMVDETDGLVDDSGVSR